jgi:two-component sensor histidine kinase/CheY-like chemotaxis protein
MLGLIKGLVQQTARGATSIEDLTTRLHDRVHALSRAYTQIERSNWQPSPLAALLLEETGAFAEPGQVIVDGSPVHLEPHAYISFALVIHELATNARKYGALSMPQGRVAVKWQVSPGGALQIDWRESGGPPVNVPTRRGFGTRVIREALEHHLGGHATLDFERAGLHACLQARSGFVPPTDSGRARPAAAPAAPAPVAATARKSARPARVPGTALVVDDDLVIAILAESMLQQLGCGQVTTAGTAGNALELLQTQRVDIALLDVNLGDHTSERVAERLAELGVPTVVTTGYSGTDSVPESMRLLRRLCKPFTQAELAIAVDQALAARA